MKKIRFNDLSEDTRRVLVEAEQNGGSVVEDEGGKARSRVYAYPEPTEAERQAAWDGIKDFQKKVQQSFDEQGCTEDDLDQLLQEDD